MILVPCIIAGFYIPRRKWIIERHKDESDDNYTIQSIDLMHNTFVHILKNMKYVSDGMMIKWKPPGTRTLLTIYLVFNTMRHDVYTVFLMDTLPAWMKANNWPTRLARLAGNQRGQLKLANKKGRITVRLASGPAASWRPIATYFFLKNLCVRILNPIIPRMSKRHHHITTRTKIMPTPS